MPRISQDQTQERHAFLLDLFRRQPDISSKEAMTGYKDKFGQALNPKTLNELRDQAEAERNAREDAEPSLPEDHDSHNDAETAGLDHPASEDAAARLKAAANPESSALPAPKPKAKGKGARNIFVDAPKEHLEFLERIIQQLQEAGASNLRVDHSTDRWLVLVVDAK